MCFVTARNALQLEAKLVYAMCLHELGRENEQKLWDYWLHGYVLPYALTPKDKRAEWMGFEEYKKRCEDKVKTDEVPWEVVEAQTSDIRDKFNRGKVKK